LQLPGFGKAAGRLPAGWAFTISRVRRLKVFIILLCGDRLAIQGLIKQGVRNGLEVLLLFADGFLGMVLRRASIALAGMAARLCA